MAEFVSREIQFLFPIWNRNRIISLKRKKKLQKVARSPREAEEPTRPQGAPHTWETARHGQTTLEWIRGRARPRALQPSSAATPKPPNPAAKPNLKIGDPTTGQSQEPSRVPAASQGKRGHCVPQFPPFNREGAPGATPLSQDRARDAASPGPRARGPPSQAAQGQMAAFFPSTGTCSTAPRAL